MYEDGEKVNYDGAVRVPSEIRNVRDPIMFGLTGRELLCLVGGMGVVLLTSFIVFGLFHLRNRAFLFIPAVFSSPLFVFGFVKPGRLFFEDFLVIWVSNNLKSAPVRKLSATNAYEQVQIIGINKKKELEGKEDEKKRKRQSKQKKPKSAYMIRQ